MEISPSSSQSPTRHGRYNIDVTPMAWVRELLQILSVFSRCCSECLEFVLTSGEAVDHNVCNIQPVSTPKLGDYSGPWILYYGEGKGLGLDVLAARKACSESLIVRSSGTTAVYVVRNPNVRA